jgi:hypothetical protein
MKTEGRYRKVLFAHAYWRNDEEGGCGVGFQFPRDSDTGNAFAHTVYRGLSDWDAMGKKPIEFFDQLRALKARGRLQFGGTDEDCFLAFMNIYWLESRKHIPTDEYNGVMWSWIPPGKSAIAMCESNPVTIVSWDAIDITKAAKSGDHEGLQAALDASRKGRPS